MQGIGEVVASRLYSNFESALVAAEEELKYVYANDIGFVTFADDAYPERLRECADSPAILYYKGIPDFSARHIVSIVGTRNATKYGVKAALKNNLKTWAVLGHSLETIYPSLHKKVADKMLESNGALISDFPHGTKIDPSNFVRRNRIVAGLCDALLVVESGEKGGSIITANIANNYNKDVFALPGNVTSTYSRGCNKLIKTNRANLCESFDDFEYIMNWTSRSQSKMPTLDFQFELTADEKKVTDVLAKYEFLDIDNLRRQTETTPNELSLILLQLEMKGAIVSLPGKIFSLKR